MAGPAVAPLDFRDAWGRLVGVLTRTHRLADPSLAEDAVQHAMLQAMRQWPASGAPDAPLAWLTTVARNHLRDALRTRRGDVTFDDDAPDATLPATIDVPVHSLAGEISDDELALLFACCDPALPVASQVALALKAVCGFSLREIASGLLSDEAAIAQRLARARKLLAARREPVALPAGAQLPPRREAVLVAIHLLFNEGYASSDVAADASPQRPDLCREAIRLARALAAQPATAHPDADALAALLLLQGAWLGARVDAHGDWRLLEEHDRAQWDGAMIAAGLAHLQRAQRAEALSAWHLRAGIASEYVTAPSFAQTDWQAIVAQYEALLRIDDAPATQLAHAVALSHSAGAAIGLGRVDTMLDRLPGALLSYGLAARADLLFRLGQVAPAVQAIEQAVGRAGTPAARRLLARKRAAYLASD
ncbi:MAG: sigma-70 family RNA polymerase sigma factor [Burkholderiaceae bacterium]|jgi:RNA polymerase sigma-70 factor (ECF subfamily)|nr:sigma-70 family RNA polymerase sigma factor [Burkholderiaceae bacterium]